jgi:mercuric ion transport protein
MQQQMTKKTNYRIEGMTCAGCERTVQKVISNIEGVQSAKASLSSANVAVEYDPEKVSSDKIKTAVGSVGYKFIGEEK